VGTSNYSALVPCKAPTYGGSLWRTLQGSSSYPHPHHNNGNYNNDNSNNNINISTKTLTNDNTSFCNSTLIATISPHSTLLKLITTHA
jgi:hypothetical protein